MSKKGKKGKAVAAPAPQPVMRMPQAQPSPSYATLCMAASGNLPGGQKPDTKAWQIIYPNYIDSAKTVKMGRRIPADKACPEPIPQEISEVCRYFKLDHSIEHYKCYSRDWLNRGRVRVVLKKENGEPVNPEVPNKKALLLKCGEMIPKSNIRAQRFAAMKNAQLQQEEAVAAAAASASSTGSNKKSKKKKKGKR